MNYDNDTKLSIKYARRFGQVALRMGFLKEEQLNEAITEQITYGILFRFKPHKLIGEILFENGWITLNHIEKVLEVINSDE